MDLSQYQGSIITGMNISRLPFSNKPVLGLKLYNDGSLCFQPTSGARFVYDLSVEGNEVSFANVMEQDEQLFVWGAPLILEPNVSPIFQLMRIISIEPALIFDHPFIVTIEGDLDLSRLGKYLDFGDGRRWDRTVVLKVSLRLSTLDVPRLFDADQVPRIRVFHVG